METSCRTLTQLGLIVGVAFAIAQPAVAAAPYTFTPTGPLAAARAGATATRLPSGDVLIAGGSNTTALALASAELYHPATRTFTATTGPLNVARAGATATLLPSGDVLIAGGTDTGTAALASAELYHPATATFTTTTGPLGTSRAAATATRLPTGDVLIAGGKGGATNVFLASAELYHPATGIFSYTTGPLTTARGTATATLLSSGKVLIAGGQGTPSPANDYLTSAELYNPATSTFGATASLVTARRKASATLLKSGKVLIAGGKGLGGAYLFSAELYDPAAGTFTATGGLGLMAARQLHTANLLPSGTVLLAGGQGSSGGYLNSAELYDPATGMFAFTGSMGAMRNFATATVLPGGIVLVAGGASTVTTPLASAELYTSDGIFANGFESP